MPLGALATMRDGTLTLQATVCALDGARYVSARGEAPAAAAAAEALGVRIAEELLACGAAELIAHERGSRAVAVEEP